MEHRVFLSRDGRHLRIAQPRGQFGQRFEYVLQIEGRVANRLEHVCGGGLLSEQFAQFVEQSRVLDRDNGLVREGFEQFDLLLAESSWLCAYHGQGANDRAFAKKGHADSGPYAGGSWLIGALELGIGNDIRNMDRATFNDRPPEH